MKNSSFKHKRGAAGIGICQTRITLNYKSVKKYFDDAREAKRKHKESTQCTGDGCTACHYWSGVISAYGALIGQSGIID